MGAPFLELLNRGLVRGRVETDGAEGVRKYLFISSILGTPVNHETPKIKSRSTPKIPNFEFPRPLNELNEIRNRPFEE